MTSKVALVTGGSSGIGEKAALRLQAAGFTTYAVARRVDRMEALMAELQSRAPEASADEWWATMELVFDLDWPQHQRR